MINDTAIPPRRERGNATGPVLIVTSVACLVVLGNHGRQFDVRQTAYASREECLKDWGDDGSCPPNTGSGRVSVYYGPRYYWDPDRGRPVVVDTNGSERVATSTRVGPLGSASGRTVTVGNFARGGFGGIGRGFSGGRGG